MLHLTGAGPAAGGVEVRHPIELVADAIWPPDEDGGADAAATADPQPARAGERAAG
jgi:hypothetical protein